MSCGQNSNQRKMPLVAKSQQSVAADIVPYDKDPRPHQMLSVTQSTSLAASAYPKEPQSTFIFNSCNFSSCPITFTGSINHQLQSSRKSDDMDDLLEGISIDQLFD